MCVDQDSDTSILMPTSFVGLVGSLLAFGNRATNAGVHHYK